MTEVTTIDLDLAKHVFQAHGSSSSGAVVFRKKLTASMINWIRYCYRIPAPILKRSDELTVTEMMQRFGVSCHVVYYWIERGVVTARRLNQGAPYWMTLTVGKERELKDWVRQSSRIQTPTDPQPQL